MHVSKVDKNPIKPVFEKPEICRISYCQIVMDIIFSFCPHQKIRRESLLPSLNDTAYPRLKTSYTQNELEQSFTPSDVEMDIAFGSINGKAPRLGFLILLKTFQRLGYFVMLTEVPEIWLCCKNCLNF